MDNKNYVYGKPFYTKEASNKSQYPYLNKDIETEVIIVGGGVTGALISYFFTKENIDCVLLEKDRIGHLSTSITTSLLQYELDRNGANLKDVLTSSNIIKAYKLGLKAIDEIEKFILEEGNKCDFKRSDCLLYTSKSIEVEEIKEEYEFRRRGGLDCVYIDNAINPFCFNIKAGIISKKGGAVLDPYKFTHSLLKKSSKNGLRAFENTEAIDIIYETNKVIVNTNYDYKVTGKIIICATGYNTKLFSKKKFCDKSYTFNIVTKPIKNLDNIYKNIVVRDNENIYHYLRTTSDNRLIFGGEDKVLSSCDMYENICKSSYDSLENKLKIMFSNYHLEIDYEYCGIFGSTNDDLGFIGKDPSRNNLYYCLGYGANGILFSTIGAKYLAKNYLALKTHSVLQFDEDINLFKVDRFWR